MNNAEINYQNAIGLVMAVAAYKDAEGQVPNYWVPLPVDIYCKFGKTGAYNIKFTNTNWQCYAAIYYDQYRGTPALTIAAKTTDSNASYHYYGFGIDRDYDLDKEYKISGKSVGRYQSVAGNFVSSTATFIQYDSLEQALKGLYGG